MTDFLYFLLLLVVLFILSQPVTVLVHEIGHAITARYFTKKPVNIFIGSYGNKQQCFRISLPAIDVYLGYNPLKWVRRGGLCVPAKGALSVSQQLIYILSGPVASIILASICLLYTLAFDHHGFTRLCLFIFLFSILFDLARNLYPDIYPAVLDDGSLVYNDGYRLRRLFLFRKYEKEYKEAFLLFKEKQFEKAASELEFLFSVGLHEKVVYQYLIRSLIELHQFSNAYHYHQRMADCLPLQTTDLHDLATIHFFLGEREECLATLDKVLEQEPDDPVALHNKGYLLAEWEQDEEGMEGKGFLPSFYE